MFNHLERAVDPRLFMRIKRLVKAKRWNITGGWYLQPDCNMPAGETIVRLVLEGRRYFKRKFNAEPTVAYNFDTEPAGRHLYPTFHGYRPLGSA